VHVARGPFLPPTRQPPPTSLVEIRRLSVVVRCCAHGLYTGKAGKAHCFPSPVKSDGPHQTVGPGSEQLVLEHGLETRPWPTN